MEHHPLLKKLLEVCSNHDVEPAKAFTTFEVYQELCEVRKFADLSYFYNEKYKLFYLSGKQEPTDESPSIFVPVMHNEEMSLQDISTLQEILSPQSKQLYLFIRDRDSSSTCYSITKALIKPDSPKAVKLKKEIEQKKYQFNKNIQNNRKLLYTRALQQQKKAEREEAGCSQNV